MAAPSRAATPAMLDTYREVVTPEGVALHLPAAGPVPRALAWGVDLFVRMAVLLVLSMVLGMLGGLGQGLYLVGMFLVVWGYPIVFEVLWRGQTPGKRALGLRVVAGDGAPVGWLPAIVRNLLRSVDMLPFGYAAGLVACLCDRDSRRLGDRVADTVVVHVSPRVAHAPVPGVPPLAPGQPLQAVEQAAIVAFGERAALLAPPRQAELADLLQPLTGATGVEGVRRLLGIANALLGRR
ncbi:RDD family protein [Pseudoxanthomonas broegbernensis]